MIDYSFRRGLSRKMCGNKSSVMAVPFDGIMAFFSTPVGKAICDAQINGNCVFQICLRENYVNVYWNGCSILKINPLSKTEGFVIHNKYMHVNSGDSEYTSLELAHNDNDLVSSSNAWSFYNGIIGPALNGDIPAVSDGHISEEKRSITEYCRVVKPVMIDLEIAFARKRTDEEIIGKKRDRVSDRIDMAVLEQHNGKTLLKLVEVKLTRDSRLKTSSMTVEPEIFRQMAHYQEFIDKEYGNIVDSYKKVASDYLDLKIIEHLGGACTTTTEQMLNAFVLQDHASSLDRSPHLLVIGDMKKLSMDNRWKIDHQYRMEQGLFKMGMPKPEYF